MKKLLFLVLMLLPLSLFAQEKLAYVNSQEIIQAMPEFVEAQKTMEKFNTDYQKELKTLQDEYNKKYSDFVQQQDSLTDNIKQHRMQELQDIQQRTDLYMQNTQQEAQKKQQDLFNPIQEKVRTAIKAVGDEKGYTYIFDAANFLYMGTSATNATAAVKTKLGLK